MANLDLLSLSVILLAISGSGILILGSFMYGKSKGFKQALLTPKTVCPSLSEVTILAKYRVPRQTNDDIIKSLTHWLMLNGFAASSFPNLIILMRVSQPLEAAKKKKYFDKLALTRDGLPAQLTLNIHSDEESNYLEVDTVCLPVMYNKMGQQAQNVFPKASIEDAQRQCQDFTDNVMCILNAKELIATYIEANSVPAKCSEFIFNTPTENNITKKAHTLIAEAKTRVLLTGWIEREILGDLESAKGRGVEVKVITKSTDGSGKTVREDFDRLIKLVGKANLRISSRFHDRFLICDGSSIIGSPYYTEDSKIRFESAIYTTDESSIEGLSNHFRRIWEDRDSKSPQ